MGVSLDALTTVRYELVDPGERGIAVVTLDRPESRNAQNKRMTYEMNACFDDAARRSDVKVIVLRADGHEGSLSARAFRHQGIALLVEGQVPAQLDAVITAWLSELG